jgi:hypothetical protein
MPTARHLADVPCDGVLIPEKQQQIQDVHQQ